MVENQMIHCGQNENFEYSCPLNIMAGIMFRNQEERLTHDVAPNMLTHDVAPNMLK